MGNLHGQVEIHHHHHQSHATESKDHLGTNSTVHPFPLSSRVSCPSDAPVSLEFPISCVEATGIFWSFNITSDRVYSEWQQEHDWRVGTPLYKQIFCNILFY